MPDGDQEAPIGGLVAWPQPPLRQGAPGPPSAPLAAPFAYITLSFRNPRVRTLFRDPFFVPLPPRFQDRGCQETLSRHPAGGRIDLCELLYDHERFSDEP